MRKVSYPEMELVVANLDDLRTEIAHAFEHRVAAGRRTGRGRRRNGRCRQAQFGQDVLGALHQLSPLLDEGMAAA